jgi:hypothetical protein
MVVYLPSLHCSVIIGQSVAGHHPTSNINEGWEVFKGTVSRELSVREKACRFEMGFWS